MSNAVYHKASKGRLAHIIKDGEIVATFSNQPTYANGVAMAEGLNNQSLLKAAERCNESVSRISLKPADSLGDFDRLFDIDQCIAPARTYYTAVGVPLLNHLPHSPASA